MLTYVAAKTQRIRLAPAVNVLPLHHPIRVAEQWATLDLLSGGRVDFASGRGYDRREYGPFGADFDDNAATFAEGLEIVQRLWESDRPISHHGKRYSFDDVWITPKPVQRPMPIYVASFSKPSIELAAKLGANLVVAAGAATSVHGGLAQVGKLYRDACARRARSRAASSPRISSISPTRRRKSKPRASGSFAITRNALRRLSPAIRTPRPRTIATSSRSSSATRR